MRQTFHAQQLASGEWSDSASICCRCPTGLLIFHHGMFCFYIYQDGWLKIIQSLFLSRRRKILKGMSPYAYYILAAKIIAMFSFNQCISKNYEKKQCWTSVALRPTCQSFAAALGDPAACSGTFLIGSGRPRSGSPSALGKGSLSPKPPLEHFPCSPDHLKCW